MPRLVLINDDGSELSAEIVSPLDTKDPGRMMWPLWTAARQLVREATGSTEDPMDAPGVIGTLINLEWRQRVLAESYRGAAVAAISLIEDMSGRPETRGSIAGLDRERDALRREVSGLYTRFRDLMVNPEGRLWPAPPEPEIVGKRHRG